MRNNLLQYHRQNKTAAEVLMNAGKENKVSIMPKRGRQLGRRVSGIPELPEAPSHLIRILKDLNMYKQLISDMKHK